MFSGHLVAIFLSDQKGRPMAEARQAEAVAGQGLQGDRYSKQLRGRSPKPLQEVTLIEIEACTAAAAELPAPFDPSMSRRNLVTQGVPLNHLVGQEFRIGEVVLEGIELCEPCGHLEKLTMRGIKKALLHRGGLRARIVAGGTLRAGDTIVPLLKNQRED